jgi:hypothetical protein
VFRLDDLELFSQSPSDAGWQALSTKKARFLRQAAGFYD